MKKDLFIISAIFFTGLIALWFFLGEFGIIVFNVLIKPNFVII